jgi:hypothetical protein
LGRFYQNGEFERTVLPILTQKEPVAVRDLDWLVTNYSKAFPVVYPNPVHPNKEPFNLHKSYEEHESHYKKGLFDPFQRGDRIHFEVNGVPYETTVAQLNFFQWAIEYGVIEWAARHRDEIKRHHDEIKKERDALIKAQPNREKKRMRLTQGDEAHCMVYLQPMQFAMGGETTTK